MRWTPSIPTCIWQLPGCWRGVICIADPLRPEAAQVLHKLRRLGITQTVMMTGDSDRTARAIAAQVGGGPLLCRGAAGG